MFRIGEFSRFTKVSVKMLRHYDEIGLLKPTLLEKVAGFDVGFPLRMITSEHVRGLIFGETYDRIDNHRNVLTL